MQVSTVQLSSAPGTSLSFNAASTEAVYITGDGYGFAVVNTRTGDSSTVYDSGAGFGVATELADTAFQGDQPIAVTMDGTVINGSGEPVMDVGGPVYGRGGTGNNYRLKIGTDGSVTVIEDVPTLACTPDNVTDGLFCGLSGPIYSSQHAVLRQGQNVEELPGCLAVLDVLQDGSVACSVAADEGGYKVVRLARDGWESTSLTPATDMLPYHAALSQDGQRIAFGAFGGGSVSVFTVAADGSDADGEPVQITSGLSQFGLQLTFVQDAN
jgi:hypothetical protein